MTIEILGSLGEIVSGFGVIVSLLYLAFQIRQNTKVARSSSYHQAAEQTRNYCLAIAQDPTLAEILTKRNSGQSLTQADTLRADAADQALLYGFENMLRLREEGLVDPEVWENLIANSSRALASPTFRSAIESRPGPLSRRLLAELDSRLHGSNSN